jgi:hypothetical protein
MFVNGVIADWSYQPLLMSRQVGGGILAVHLAGDPGWRVNADGTSGGWMDSIIRQIKSDLMIYSYSRRWKPPSSSLSVIKGV